MGIVNIDPRTKLLLLIITGALVMGSTAALPCLLLSSLLAVLLFLCGKRGFAVKGWLLCFLCIMVLPAICTHIPSGIGTIIVSLAIILRMFAPIFMALALVFKTTPISQFMAAFQKMRVPNQLVIPVAIMFRFIPTVQEEWISIRKAMSFRGISFRVRDILRHPAQMMEYVLVPLLISAVSIMDELAAASLARGLDSENRRSCLTVVKLRATDYLLMLISCGFLAWLFFGGHTLWLR